MRNFAVIPAAGGIYRNFWKPRALLTVGNTSLIERLVGQLQRNSIKPLVGIGSVGPRKGKGRFRTDHPWTDGDVAAFKDLPCGVLTSPHHDERGPLKTIVFLMEHLLENFGVQHESRIYIVYGDYVFSDALFEKVLACPAPSYSFLKIRDGFVGILTGEVIGDFIDLVKQWPDIDSPIILHETTPEGMKAIGLEEIPPIRLLGPDFIEIDGPGDYEFAIRLVARKLPHSKL